MSNGGAKAPDARPATPADSGRSLVQLKDAVQRAEGGDPKALAEVREWLAKPGLAGFLGGDLAKEALERFVRTYAGGNPVVYEAVNRKLTEMRGELSGSNPTTVEKLLVERVLATWLHLHHLEAVYAGKENVSLALGLYYQKAISAAQKRYLAALKGLAEVRKLALPAVQVNIARKQINLGTGVVTS
ncbi:hypothetical protein R5W23_003400 [Gemmata sp. JC673]|uniref:Uncharacterized protein n=1 Tax=Gemmata algarum TaxID=2975278 RepID=A0ABU5F388_9BACT|nr:hypothetical protein [Gemmata algarum]MDY3561969.1 hypothetical protein [Gemmata algarum]